MSSDAGTDAGERLMRQVRDYAAAHPKASEAEIAEAFKLPKSLIRTIVYTAPRAPGARLTVIDAAVARLVGQQLTGAREKREKQADSWREKRGRQKRVLHEALERSQSVIGVARQRQRLLAFHMIGHHPALPILAEDGITIAAAAERVGATPGWVARLADREWPAVRQMRRQIQMVLAAIKADPRSAPKQIAAQLAVQQRIVETVAHCFGYTRRQQAFRQRLIDFVVLRPAATSADVMAQFKLDLDEFEALIDGAEFVCEAPSRAWRRPKLTPRVRRIIEMLDLHPDATLQEIADIAGVTRERVRQVAQQHRPQWRARKMQTKSAKDERIAAIYEANPDARANDIAEQLGVPVARVYRIRAELGVATPYEIQQRRILDFSKAHPEMGPKAVAQALGLVPKTVQNVRLAAGMRLRLRRGAKRRAVSRRSG